VEARRQRSPPYERPRSATKRTPLSTAAAIGAILTVASAPACGTKYPAVVSNEIRDGGEEAEGAAIDLTSPGVPSCNTGPEDGVCGCLDLPLLTKAPNLYFILDRSGSMSDSNKWNTIRTAISQMMTDLGPRANFGAAVFPAPDDASNACAAGVEVESVRPGDSPAGRRGPTNEYLIEATNIPAAGGTPTAATIRNLTPRLASLHDPTFAIVATDGGPNCDADIQCTAADCMLNIESSVAGCTPDGTLDCCSASEYGPTSCLDGTATVDAIRALRARGVDTFVMGIPGSGPYAAILDEMAEAGGTARSSKPYYYPVLSTDEGAFYGALSKIAAHATGTCLLPLGQPPKDPSLLNVYLGGAVVPEEGPNGWTYADASVTLLGASCDEVLSGDVLDVRVVEGCPTVEK
jgi:hypothetical protein